MMPEKKLSQRMRRLHEATERGDRDAVQKILATMPDHAKDLLVACHCGAGEGEECTGTERKIVHIGRRLKRLLAGIR